MQKFSGYEYLLIDLANNFGLDKLLFPQRIEWATTNLNQLEQLVDQGDKKTKPQYLKAVMDIRKVQQGLPTGHLVALDAVCSGIQIMSALTGCIKGATATGLVDPNVRADAYTQLTADMCTLLGTVEGVSREPAKDAMMTMFYGSKKQPKEIFGADTPELNAFYEASQAMAPGAWELLQDLLGSWRPFALKHSWKLPDGFDVVVKVMQKIEPPPRIEVDELDHATFTYEFYVNEGSKKGLSNVANVVHSVDAYVLRCIHRRCNYNRAQVEMAAEFIQQELALRENFNVQLEPLVAGQKLAYYVDQYNRSGMADVVILSCLHARNVNQLSTQHLEQLNTIIKSMLVHQPFPVVSVHDEFKCGANHMNHLRQHYIDVFAELAESELLSDILSQIHGTPGVFPKLSNNLGSLIRNSNYALS